MIRKLKIYKNLANLRNFIKFARNTNRANKPNY